MDNILVSDAERFFIIQGTQLGCRLDGRQSTDYRPIEIETGILNHTASSARVKIGNTSVIACVSIEIGEPSTDIPDQGRIIIDVECSPTATPKFSGKAGSAISDTLKTILSSAFTQDCLPLQKLCIQPGKQCWILYTDLLFLESDGNLLDAASLSIVSALSTLKLPTSLAKTFANDKETMSTNMLSINNLSTFVTIHKIGNSLIVDPNKEEEACSISRVSVAVKSDGCIASLIKEGCGSLQLDTLMDMIEIGQKLGREIHSSVQFAIAQEQKIKALE